MEVAPGISENIMREGTCRRTAFKGVMLLLGVLIYKGL